MSSPESDLSYASSYPVNHSVRSSFGGGISLPV